MGGVYMFLLLLAILALLCWAEQRIFLHGARPTVASTVPTSLSDDDRNTLHQLAFELGGTDGGEYLLDAEALDELIDAALAASTGQEV